MPVELIVTKFVPTGPVADTAHPELAYPQLGVCTVVSEYERVAVELSVYD
jgi:hypothetical protein